MALKDYQVALSASTLYEVTLKGGLSGRGGNLNASIWCDAAISIYGSDSATQPASLSDMTLEAENTDVTGHLVLSAALSTIPRYIAITGAATEIIASGLSVESLGAIS